MPTTVILGAGIIGLSSAHALAALAPPEHRIHLVEPSPRLFASASGKAAGFLAKDWFAPAIAPLATLSFELHRALADAHSGRARWGYAESIAYSLDQTARSDDSGSDSVHSGGSLPAPVVLAPVEPHAGTQIIDDGAQPDVNVSGHSGSHGSGGLDWLLQGVTRASAEADFSDKDNKASSIHSDRREAPQWLRAKPDALEAISDRRTTAQVHPKRLCEFLLEQCLAAGVILHQPARATRLLRDEKDQGGLTRLRVEYPRQQSESGSPDGRARVVDLPCENIVIAAGCWTSQAYATLFPNANRMPRISHLAGYSLTFRSKHWTPAQPAAERETGIETTVGSSPAASRETDAELEAAAAADLTPTESPTAAAVGESPTCHAIFTDMAGFAPEIFSRATGDLWLGGLNPSPTDLPALPTDAQIDAEQVERLLAVARALCGSGSGVGVGEGEGDREGEEESDIEVRTQALCFRPVSATGRPIIARVHEADLGDGLKPGGGVFVASGHGPWGIALSLGTGRVVAEMVLGRETCVDVAALARW